MIAASKIAIVVSLLWSASATAKAATISLFFDDTTETPNVLMSKSNDVPDDIVITITPQQGFPETFTVKLTNFFVAAPTSQIGSDVFLVEPFDHTIGSDTISFSWSSNPPTRDLLVSFDSTDFKFINDTIDGVVEMSPYNQIPVPSFPAEARVSLDVKVASDVTDVPEPGTLSLSCVTVVFVLVGCARPKPSS